MARMWGECLEIKGRDGPGQIQKSCSHHRRGQGCKAKGELDCDSGLDLARQGLSGSLR